MSESQEKSNPAVKAEEEGVVPGAEKRESGADAKKRKETEVARESAAEARGKDDDLEDEYEWSDWEEEAEEFVRPEKLVPIFGGVADTAAGPAAEGKAGTAGPVPDDSRGRRLLPIGLVMVLGVLAAGGILYLHGEIRAMAERLDRIAQETASAIQSGEETGPPVSGAAAEEAVEIAGESPAAAASSGVAAESGVEKPAAAPGMVARKLEERIQFLEQRMRLTRLADEAISSGSRYAFKQLEEAFDDPALTELKVAANSEIIRVESIYARTAGMRYIDIPVKMIDPSLTSDRELSVSQLGDLLISSSAAPEMRARAAELLGELPSFEACAYLIECVRTEPNLAVLVEATRSFKKLSGYDEGRVFASKRAEEWFFANQAAIKMEFSNTP